LTLPVEVGTSKGYCSSTWDKKQILDLSILKCQPYRIEQLKQLQIVDPDTLTESWHKCKRFAISCWTKTYWMFW
jgi:hypothetical protein